MVPYAARHHAVAAASLPRQVPAARRPSVGRYRCHWHCLRCCFCDHLHDAAAVPLLPAAGAAEAPHPQSPSLSRRSPMPSALMNPS